MLRKAQFQKSAIFYHKFKNVVLKRCVKRKKSVVASFDLSLDLESALYKFNT